MKKLLFVFGRMSIGIGAFAQGSAMGFGIKAGVNFPKYNYTGSNSSYESNSNVSSFHVTGFLDAPLVSNILSVQPGISLQGKGAEVSGTLGTYSQNTMWIEVPVNLVAKMPTGGSGNFFVGAGPYVGFGISGKNKYSNWIGTTEEEFDFGKNGTLKSTDFGVNIIAGYQLNGGLMIHGGYGMGLSDIRGSNNEYFPDNRLTNRVWTVGLGFAL